MAIVEQRENFCLCEKIYNIVRGHIRNNSVFSASESGYKVQGNDELEYHKKVKNKYAILDSHHP